MGKWFVFRYKHWKSDPDYYYKFIALDQIKMIRYRPEGHWVEIFLGGRDIFYINGMKYDEFEKELMKFKECDVVRVILAEYQQVGRTWEG